MPDTPEAPKKRVLSGMRPTGKLHLGNYMGALKNWVDLQDKYECFFFIADIHALTTDYADPSQIKQNTVDVALDFLAAGLDPEKCTIFIQSHVPQHAELHLLFSMITPLGWLERVPSYKDQQENIKGKDLTTYGFLGYPLLQSADILLYQPDYVPVGADQVAHVELTREVARRFNSLYKTNVFPEPSALLTPTPKLPGIDGRKMSKSYGNTIGLSESPATVSAKIQNMSTNGQRISQTDPGNPDLCPVGDLHKVFSPLPVMDDTQISCRTAAILCEQCKMKAAHSVTRETYPIYEKRRALEADIDQTWEMLISQSDKAAKCAEETMLPVRAALNITRDLGRVRRNFVMSPEDREELRDLSDREDITELPQFELERKLREYWRNDILPPEYRLSLEANRTFASIEREIEEPFITAKKKRVFVGAAKNQPTPNESWEFEIPLKSYEVWVLLVVDQNNVIRDFVIPQRIFATVYAHRKNLVAQRLMAAFPLYAWIRKSKGQFTLSFPPRPPIDITELLANYEPLS